MDDSIWRVYTRPVAKVFKHVCTCDLPADVLHAETGHTVADDDLERRQCPDRTRSSLLAEITTNTSMTETVVNDVVDAVSMSRSCSRPS